VAAVLAVAGVLLQCHAPRIGPAAGAGAGAGAADARRNVRQGSSEHTMRKLAEIPILACSLDKRFFSGRASCGFEQV
jgi:hypothetical protein